MSNPETAYQNNFEQFLEVPSVSGKPDIHLRLSSMDDAEELNRFFAENPYLQEYQPFTREIADIDGARKNIASALMMMSEDEWMQYRIIEGHIEERGPICGTVTLYDHKPGTRVSTATAGVYIGENYQGRGYASRANRTVIEYAQNAWGLHTVHFEIADGNTASETLATRLGATLMPHASVQEMASGDRLLRMRTWSKEL
ncbi:MAG: GNAT family N-acetyltransferase [Candidatus Saccharimonadales bacterium]